MRTVEITLYKFEELSEESKNIVIGYFSDINVDYDWWKNIYFEDAKQIGLKISGFDMDRYCHGNFFNDGITVANLILEKHGDQCETYKHAEQFRKQYNALKDGDEVVLEELESEFELALLEDYRIMLREEYEYLTSEEAIVETIQANDYEFTSDGKLYR